MKYLNPVVVPSIPRVEALLSSALTRLATLMFVFGCASSVSVVGDDIPVYDYDNGRTASIHDYDEDDQAKDTEYSDSNRNEHTRGIAEIERTCFLASAHNSYVYDAAGEILASTLRSCYAIQPARTSLKRPLNV